MSSITKFSLKIFLLLSAIHTALNMGAQVPTKTEYYTVDKCTSTKECEHVCDTLNIPELTPLCDRNGTCVCDCSNMEIVNSRPVPPPCSKWISSFEHDSCSQYCTQIYERPYKLCGETGPQKLVFCTALCKWY